MTEFLKATGATIALGALAATGALEARPRLTGEAELARLLEGRVAGRPMDCLMLTQTDDVRIIDKTALVYGSGRTIYVNRPRHPQDLDRDDILVTRLHMPQLCKLDAVRLHDRSSHMFSGFVTLEQFVPYRRIEAARR
jgi:hypothetical protein